MWLLILSTLVVAWLIFRLVSILRADADLSLLRACARGVGSSLDGKVVWVTGASSGIGEYTAMELARHGAILVLSARREAELARVKDALKGPRAKEAMVLQLDLLDVKSHAQKVQEVVKRFGRIDVLLNNGGRSQRALAETTSLDVDRDMLELNVIGTVSLTKAVLPQMIKQSAGHIATISSVAGKMGAPVSASYAMSKHALQGFFDTLRIEVASSGISVGMICPGPVVSHGAENSFTGTTGEVVGSYNVDDKKKLSTERCAELVTAAVAHRLDEVWISRQPILFFMYVTQYMPTLGRHLAVKLGRARVDAFKTGNKDINSGFSLKGIVALLRK